MNFIITKDQLTLQVCPDRLERLQAQIQSILLNNALQPMEAQKLAGKLVFLQTTTFGNVGRALTYPLYARAHGLGHDSEHVKLNHPLRDALLTLHHVLKDLRPRAIPLQVGGTRQSCTQMLSSQGVTEFSNQQIQRFRLGGALLTPAHLRMAGVLSSKTVPVPMQHMEWHHQSSSTNFARGERSSTSWSC